METLVEAQRMDVIINVPDSTLIEDCPPVQPKPHEKLWTAFFETRIAGDSSFYLRELVNHYYPLVRTVAKRMYQKLAEVTEDELASMGVDGLYDAIRHFDPSRNTKFETYAMHRIRG